MTDQPIPGPHWQLIAVSDNSVIALPGNVVLGREQGCDIVITTGKLSRRHAQFTLENDVLTLLDLGSTNGTFVNGQRLEAATIVKNGDTVRFDSVVYQVAYHDPDSTTFTPVDKTQPEPAVVDEPAPVEVVPVAPVSVPTPTPTPTPAPAPTPTPAKDSVAPPSWAVERSRSDSTQIMSDDMLEDLKRRRQANEAAKHVSSPTLVGKSEPVTDKQFALQAQNGSTQWEIGRAAECEVCIDHPSISINHAQIVNEGSKWKVIDSMSANGTYVNGEKGLTSYLSNGDMIRFGQVEFQILLPAAAPASARKSRNKQPVSLTKYLLTALAVAVVVAIGAIAVYWLKVS